MLKVCGGELRGRRIKAPPGLETRPTSAKVRQALFNILGARVDGARVCDLFAGAGALGIEALSRGAASCLFVELRRPVIRVIGQNLDELGLQERSRIIMADAAAPSARLLAMGPFDLAFADPPYKRGFVARLVRLASTEGFLTPQGLMVVEHSPGEPPAAEGVEIIDHRVYGQTELSLLRPAAQDEGQS